MHTVTIVSAFRDSASHVASYAERILNLDYDPACLRLVCVEGDSVDGTWTMLQRWASWDRRVILVKCDTGKKRYGSVIHPERFQILAQVFNAGMDAVDLEWSEYVMFIPSDIQFKADLLAHLVAHNKDLIAPFTFTDDRHYDLWAMSRNGRDFGWFLEADVPALFGTEPIEMSTIGGTLLMKADVLRSGARYTPEEVDRGLCKMARERGFSCWVDPTLKVRHG